jgi:hypothetical protein
VSKRETIRRLLAGDLLTVVRHRYGHTLPDDDSGRDDLYLMLRLAALADRAADKKMRNVIELYAPWAGDEERQWIDELEREDPRRVWLDGKELGQRLNLTNPEREALKVWRIAPVNLDGELISAEYLAEQRKAKDRERKWRKRGTSRRRDVYEAESLSSRKPWLADGISRRTWERRRRKSGVASVSATIVYRSGHTCVTSPGLSHRPRAGSGKGVRVTDTPETEGQVQPSLSPLPSSTTDKLATSPSTEHGSVSPRRKHRLASKNSGHAFR